MIVDQAEEDTDLVSDPFLEAGINISSDLPYQEKDSKENYKNDRKGELKSNEEEEAVPLFKPVKYE